MFPAEALESNLFRGAPPLQNREPSVNSAYLGTRFHGAERDKARKLEIPPRTESRIFLFWCRLAAETE
jgi:hypothetical protein